MRTTLATTIATTIALLTLTGCVAMSPDELARQQRAEVVPIDTSRVWTYPVIFHGASVTFEVLPQEKPEFVLPTPQMDLIGVGGTPPRGIGFRFNRFHIQGRSRARHDDAAYYLHRAPAAGEEWRHEGPPLTIVWQGNGRAFPVAEYYPEPDSATGSAPGSATGGRRAGAPQHVIWTIAGTRIHHHPSGAVEVKRAREVRRTYAPTTIRLAADGEILAIE